MRLTIALVVSALLSFVPAPAEGKCVFAKYEVAGGIISLEGVDFAQLRVYFFLEGADHTSDYLLAEGERDYVVPDSKGRFSITAWMSSSSGYSWFGGHRCRHVVSSGDIFIVGRGVRAYHGKVRFDQTKRQIRVHQGASAMLPGISLKRIRIRGGGP